MGCENSVCHVSLQTVTCTAGVVKCEPYSKALDRLLHAQVLPITCRGRYACLLAQAMAAAGCMLVGRAHCW